MPSKFDTLIEKISLLNESITFSIADADENPATNILELTFKLNRPLFMFMDKNFTREEMEHYNSNRPMDVLSPDGFDAFEEKGTMNFYCAGFPERLKEKTISLLKYYIEENNAELNGEVKKDVSKVYNTEVYRFPIKIKPVDDDKLAPELNVSNATGLTIVGDILNYPKDYSGSVQIQELMMKIGMIEDNDFIINNAVREPASGGGETSAKWYDGGLSRDRIKQVLDALKRICEWGIAHNYSTITWG